MESGLLAHSDEPCDAVSKPDGRRRGGWRAARFLIAVGFLERVGFNGVQGNLVMYLAGPMGMSTAAAAAGANAWAGTVLVLTLVGALAADSRLGRYQAIVAAAVLHLLSLAMLTISSMTQATHPHPLSCHDAATACSPPPLPSPARLVFFHAALYLLALAQGFHNPCSEAFGADQFASSDHGARASRSSYFNWYHFFNSCGYAISNTALSYVEDNVSWTLGFTACFAMTAVYLPVFLLGTGTYRAEQPVDGGGATLARLVEASSSATRAWTARAFRRKDAICTERLLAKEEVEDGKGFFVKLLPIWVTSIVFTTVVSQQTTLFTKQGSTMDRRVGPRAGGGGGIVVPAAALQCVVSFTSMTLVPVYDRAIVPLARRFTGHPAGITTLQRVGAGMAISCHAMVVAALVEAKRLRAASDAGLIDRPDATVPMGVWWLVPQYLLVGLARVFGDIGLDEFFYDQAPDGLRSVGLAMSMSVRGVGNYVSGVLVSVIDTATRSGGESWFSDDLNRAHLDYFYWILAAFAALEVVVFVYIAKRYIYKNKGES